MSQCKKDLFFGYIREIQQTLPKNNPYYNITDDLKDICASFIYWFHVNLNDMNTDLNKNRFINILIIKQQARLEQIDLFADDIERIFVDRFTILVDRGFLNPAFLRKIENDPEEIWRFIRQNRGIVGDQLDRRLNPSIRPTISRLIAKGILLRDDYIQTESNAIIAAISSRINRKYDELPVLPTVSSNNVSIENNDDFSIENVGDLSVEYKSIDIKETIQSLENIFNLSQRPSMQDLVTNGIAEMSSMVTYFDVNVDEINDTLRMEMKYSDELRGMLNGCNNIINAYKKDEFSEALICTVTGGLSNICIDIQTQETKVLDQMALMNEEMKNLRDSLDKYKYCGIFEDPDVVAFERDEESIREKFQLIQSKLLTISAQQNVIHDKLRRLHIVEHSLNRWKTNFYVKLRKLYFYQQMIHGDIQKLNGMDMNIDDGLIELKELKESVGYDLCNERIKGFQQLYSWHNEMENVEGLKTNELMYHSACFVLIIIFGENIPPSIKDLILLFAVIK